MKIGILQTGRSPDEVTAAEGDYDALFRALLADQGFTFQTYPVLDGVLPASVTEADGWLITGSRFGVYEDHDWIPPLEGFIRAAYAQSVPIVGVCFGHQILAQALGGKVEKFQGGWSVGRVDYTLGDATLPLMAWHQDQVVELPADATVLGHSDFCKYAFLQYGDRAFSCQPHPEFTPTFFDALLAARGDVLPEEISDRAARSVTGTPTLATQAMADRFAAFFRQGAGQRAGQGAGQGAAPLHAAKA